ncbi:MAG: hypothetical protein NTV46_15880 [Verrucomicrobia bacterium]|nr:hypothetical protein [Verrucomicrobiota bacterium]
MTLGPNIILKIPATGSLVKISTIGSGNTFGARWWTDGKMEAPMLPDDPWLRRHPVTGETFWCDECEKVASEGPWGEGTQYSEVPYAEDAAENDFQAQLSLPSLSPDKERYIRTRLWWLWNDPARNSDDSGARPAGFDANLRKLGLLLSHDEDDSRLMAAECFRELGDHEKAAELLDFNFPEEFQATVGVIFQANEERNVCLLEIA